MESNQNKMKSNIHIYMKTSRPNSEQKLIEKLVFLSLGKEHNLLTPV